MLESEIIQGIRSDPQYLVKGAFFFTQEEYDSIRALDSSTFATFYVTSTRCAAQGADLEAQIELAAEFLYRGCDVAICTGEGQENDLSSGGEVCFITTEPSFLWKLSEYMQSDTGTLYRVSPQIETLQQRFNTKVWPLSKADTEVALSRVTMSDAERELRHQDNREFFEYSGHFSAVGCLYMKKDDYESFMSLPQQGNCVFTVYRRTTQKYKDDREASISTAEIFAAAGCQAEVFYGKGTENELYYEGYVCFVTSTPERMWEVGTELQSSVGSDYFFVEPQYERVKSRMDTLIWQSENA